MISYLKGKIIEIGKNWLILDVNGVGYRVYTTNKVLNSLAKTSSKVNLYTKFLFNQHESVFEIFGFLNKDDLEAFELLNSVSGIGPKSALNILSSIKLEELIAAVSKEDSNYLRKISGLGPKTAKRLVLELKDKFGKISLGRFSKIDLDQEIEAIEALISLGYQKTQAQEALRKVPKKNKSLENRVKEALKILSK